MTGRFLMLRRRERRVCVCVWRIGGGMESGGGR
jgi:hypothetical protein